MEECIFCKIAAGGIPSLKVYETESILAFEDIHPMSPVHIIIIPKRHIATLMDVGAEEMADLQAMMVAAQEVARIRKIDRSGFRVVINCNEEGGQLIFHLHMHLLGGKKLRDGLD